MPEVAIETTMPCPSAVVAPRLLMVLAGYGVRNDIALALDLGVAHAVMSVPVTVTLGEPVGPTESEAVVPLVLTATHRARWFPTFHGEACSQAISPLDSTLLLRGAYETPLGVLGTVADRTVMATAAEHGLASFLDRLRTDVLEEVRRSEFDLRSQTARGH